MHERPRCAACETQCTGKYAATTCDRASVTENTRVEYSTSRSRCDLHVILCRDERMIQRKNWTSRQFDYVRSRALKIEFLSQKLRCRRMAWYWTSADWRSEIRHNVNKHGPAKAWHAATGDLWMLGYLALLMLGACKHTRSLKPVSILYTASR